MTGNCLTRAWLAHQTELHAFLHRRVDSPALADDLLQEIFVRASAQGKQFCQLHQPRAWLFRVARNLLIDQCRRQHPAVSLSPDLPATTAEPAPVELLTVCLPRNLSRLAQSDRDIVQHCDLQGSTVNAYALQHGLSLPAAKARLRRARQRLRRALVEHCAVSFDEQGLVASFKRRSNND